MALAILSKLSSELKLDKRKQVFVIVFLWVVLLLLAGSAIDKYKNTMAATLNIPEEDRKLKDALLYVNPISLDSLVNNVKKTMKLQELLSNVTVRLKSDKKEGDNSPVNLNLQKKLDRIGEHVDVTIDVKGDLYEQLLLLKKLENNYINLVLIKSVKGDGKSMVVEAAIYGKK